MSDKNNVIALNGLVDPSGKPITLEEKAKAFMNEYGRLCARYQLQFKPVFIFSGANMESRLEVETMVHESAN